MSKSRRPAAHEKLLETAERRVITVKVWDDEDDEWLSVECEKLTGAIVNDIFSDLKRRGVNTFHKALMREDDGILLRKSEIITGRVLKLVDVPIQSQAPSTATTKPKAGSSSSHGEQKIDIKMVYKELKDMNRRLKKMEKSIQDLRSPVMSIDSSPYKETLTRRTAKAYCLSITRLVDEETIKKIVQDVLEEKAADLQLYNMAVRWVKNRLTDFRVDERRKLFGISPYGHFTEMSSLSLARTIMKTIKAPTEYSVLKTYTRHISLVRRFMQDCPDKAQERGKLWQNLSTYVEEKYPRGISELTEDDPSSQGSHTSNSDVDQL